MRWAVGARTARDLTRRNSLPSPYLWLLCLIAVVPATLFWRHTLHLFCFVVVFAFTYVWLYVSIVCFKSPRWLVVRKNNQRKARAKAPRGASLKRIRSAVRSRSARRRSSARR